MSGGMLGGGDAWARDHEEILEHARGLGYDKVEGVSLPPADAPKETWISEMDKFNAWKASELAKPEASRWWVTRPWTPLEGTVSPEGGGGSVSSGSASVARPSVASSPVPSNPYYPQLVQEYDAPSLMDYSAYMPADSLFGYEQYQPYTNPNAIDPSIFNYQPPTIYATDPRISLGGLARTSGVGGRIMPTRPMGGGEFGIEDGSSETASDPATGTFDADDYVIPGTNTTAQSLFDYEAGDISETIRDQEGNIERRYYVPPPLRADIVRADIERARQDAYIKNAEPLVTTIGQIELTPAEAVKRYNSGHLPNILADQVAADIARVANEVKFRPRSREEAQGGSSPDQVGTTPGERGYSQGVSTSGANANWGGIDFG